MLKRLKESLPRLTRFLLFVWLGTFGFFIFLFPNKTYAHPGNTDSFGCHTCSTNCTSWDLYYGEYHCHTPKYTIPTCPLFSSYNSISDTCECYSGYVASGGSCISKDQNCKNTYGYSSRYNSLYNKCECSTGYVIDSSGKCSSGDSVCWNKYGYNSSFNSLDNTCECRYGYVFNQSGSKCISEDEACKEQFGYDSKASLSGGKCECRDGYEWEGSRCVLQSFDIAPISVPENSLTPTPKATSAFSPTPSSKGTSATSPTPTIAIQNQTNEKNRTAGWLVGTGFGSYALWRIIKWIDSKAPDTKVRS